MLSSVNENLVRTRGKAGGSHIAKSYKRKYAMLPCGIILFTLHRYLFFQFPAMGI